MRFLAIYFTGTGNSKRVIDAIEHSLTNFNHTLEKIDVTKDEVKNIDNYDGLIISYPIYGFNAPKPIISYVKKMSKATVRKPCLIMKQSGEHLFWNNASSLYLTSLLKKRNIVVTNEYHYLMPYSFIFRHSDYMAYRMNNVMEQLVTLDLNDFVNGQEAHMKRFFMDRLFAWVLRIQWFGGRLNGKFYKVETKKCITCLKCIKECPSHNIYIKDGKIKFKGGCLMCQRCVMYCPKHAIKVGMFNSWRVDQPYTFKEAPYQKEKKPNYCKKNYIKYFKTSEERIEKSKAQ